MFEKLKRLFNMGKLTEATLQNAVAKDWITNDQMNEITNKIE